jgi:hypothetical protein
MQDLLLVSHGEVKGWLGPLAMPGAVIQVSTNMTPAVDAGTSGPPIVAVSSHPATTRQAVEAGAGGPVPVGEGCARTVAALPHRQEIKRDRADAGARALQLQKGAGSGARDK